MIPGIAHRARRRGPARILRAAAILMLCAAALPALAAALELPPPPDRRINDYAGILDPAVRAGLEARLADLERETSDQIVVATFPSLEDENLEDWVNRLFNHWRLGQAGLDNGVLLAVFMAERRARIEVGYGLEERIPDILCARIIREDLAPPFRAGRYDEGVTRAVDSLDRLARGGAGAWKAERDFVSEPAPEDEPSPMDGFPAVPGPGSDRPGAESSWDSLSARGRSAEFPWRRTADPEPRLRTLPVDDPAFAETHAVLIGVLLGIVLLFLIFLYVRHQNRGYTIDRRTGRRTEYESWLDAFALTGGFLGGNGHGGGGFGGGGGGSGGGGFSGGGGSSGGGGASGGW